MPVVRARRGGGGGGGGRLAELGRRALCLYLLERYVACGVVDRTIIRISFSV